MLRFKSATASILLLLLTLAACSGMPGAERRDEMAWEYPVSDDNFAAAPAESSVQPASNPAASGAAVSGYARQQLSPAEQAVYDRITAAIEQQEATVEGITTVDQEQLKRIGRFIRIDHPEFFWMDGSFSVWSNTLNGQLQSLDYEIHYTMDPAQRQQAQAEIDRITLDLWAQIPANASDYEKALAVHDYIIQQADYDSNFREDQSLYSVLTSGRGVCSGYARATQYLLQQLGIECSYVSGQARSTTASGSHAWNLVQLDGDYYYLDNTWDDPSYLSSTRLPRDSSYDYFLITTAEIQRTHTPDAELALPVCQATRLNYYSMNQLLLSEYDYAAIQQLIGAAIQRQATTVTMKFTTAAAYQQARQQLFGNKAIYDMLQVYIDNLYGADNRISLSYFPNDTMYILTIALPQ